MNIHAHVSRLMSPSTKLPTAGPPPRAPRRPLLPLPPRTNSAPTLVKGGICEREGFDVFRSRLAQRMQKIARAVREVRPRREGSHLEDTHGDAVLVLAQLAQSLPGVCPFCADEFMDVINFAQHIGNCPLKK